MDAVEWAFVPAGKLLLLLLLPGQRRPREQSLHGTGYAGLTMGGKMAFVAFSDPTCRTLKLLFFLAPTNIIQI